MQVASSREPRGDVRDISLSTQGRVHESGVNLRICACVQHSSSPSGRTAQAQTGIHELETRQIRQQCWKNSCMDFKLRTSAVFGFIHAESKDQHNPDCRLHAPARAPLHWTRTSSLNCTWKLSTISRSFSNTGVCRCAPAGMSATRPRD